jgi:hypothetical protein
MQESNKTETTKETVDDKSNDLVPTIKVEENQTLIVSKVEEVEAAEEVVENQVPNVSLSGERSSFNLSNTTPALPSNFTDVEDAVKALASMQALAQVLIKSNLCPLPKVEDVILAIITGNQYGLPFMASINQIVPIKNKPTLSAHLHRALLLKHGIMFEKLADNQPMFDWARIKDDGSGYVMIDIPLPNGTTKKIPQILKRSTIEEKPTEKCIPSAEVDRITKYKFTRVLKGADGKYMKMEVISEYKISDANRAGLLEKDNWMKHTPRMLDARAFTTGAREIAADITLGIYALNELADEFNVPYTISASLEESLINQ